MNKFYSTVLFGLAVQGCGLSVVRSGPSFAEVQSLSHNGVLDPTVAWMGPGFYSDVDLSALPPSSVCSNKSIFGVTGTAVCVASSGPLDVSAAFVAGNYDSVLNLAASLYRSSVSIFGILGTMLELSSLNFSNSSSGGSTLTLMPREGYRDGYENCLYHRTQFAESEYSSWSECLWSFRKF